MKFLVQHNRTQTLLETWADGQPLILSKHFFWLPGSKEQKSLRGFLSTLLHDSLKQRQALIPDVLPEAWNEASSIAWQANTNIRLDEKALRSAMKRLLQAQSNYRICFFIDGLDEFENVPNFDHQDLIKLLKKWMDLAPDRVKMCVSSRELEPFNTAFITPQKIRLQSLTRADIAKMVRERLAGCKLDHGDLHLLQSRIIARAEGVFLWVSLVLQSIRKSLEHESIEQLMAQIKKTPSDVEQLLDRIFDSISNDEMACRTVAMIQTIAEKRLPEMTLFAYSFLDDYVHDHSFAFKEPSSSLAYGQMLERVQRARKQLIGRCQGLLEVQYYNYSEWRKGALKPIVTVAHRSVYDFLRAERIQHRMFSSLADFNQIDAICQTFLAEIKAIHVKVSDLMVTKGRVSVGSPQIFSKISLNSSSSQTMRKQGSPVISNSSMALTTLC
jgi:hypothetical protein